MLRTWRSVIPERRSLPDRAGGNHSNDSDSSSAMRPSSARMPINVTAMLFAVDQVRVRVVKSKPGA